MNDDRMEMGHATGKIFNDVQKNSCAFHMAYQSDGHEWQSYYHIEVSVRQIKKTSMQIRNGEGMLNEDSSSIFSGATIQSNNKTTQNEMHSNVSLFEVGSITVFIFLYSDFI